MNLNKVFLIGYLTRNPEIKHTPKGIAIGELNIVIEEFRNEKEEYVFVDITTFGKTAENCAQYLQKASAIFCEGRLQLDQWTTNDGAKRQKLKVIAERIQFLSKPKKEQKLIEDKPSYPPKEDDSSLPF